MTHVTVSPKYQVVIPRALRERLKLRSGQKMSVLEKAGAIIFIPEIPISKYRGLCEGLSDHPVREKQDRV